MLPFKDDEDFKQRRNVAAKYFCEPPKLAEGKPLVVRDIAGLMELSFALFAGWLFSGILNRDKPLLRPCLLPVGDKGESSVLSLYNPSTHLAAPARRKLDLLDEDYFRCPLDTATKPLTATERHLCPVVNKLRYNLAHAKPEWDVTGLAEPAKTNECCESRKELLWQYLGNTLLANPDLYGSMVGGAAYPIQLPFSILKEYLTGVSPGTRDLGKLLEETLLWFAQARSGVLMGGAHVIFTKPFECYEIDILLYECAGKYKPQKEEPAGGWPIYTADQSICVMELTIGHQPTQTEEGPIQEKKKGHTEGNDAPKNKLVNYLALTSYGFRRVQANYISFIRDKTMHQATQQALEKTEGFNYVPMPDRLGCDVEQTVLKHHDSRVSVKTLRDWHTALVRVVEEIGASFAASLR